MSSTLEKQEQHVIAAKGEEELEQFRLVIVSPFPGVFCVECVGTDDATDTELILWSITAVFMITALIFIGVSAVV
ncbi:hypothetical protein [Paraburkholderia caribensis]|uniref:hypothetical protein n=1 Tax=Paraburkholderia caribensis TaxID=75105 RepID=UPI001CAFCA7B|nr:hypothetical protein [Paraburkholderia caribensis]CAG9242134.1 hypothetical protein PCAR4_1140023 [Paraburkholderia caribensis]